jgi:hypothetical protein
MVYLTLVYKQLQKDYSHRLYVCVCVNYNMYVVKGTLTLSYSSQGSPALVVFRHH